MKIIIEVNDDQVASLLTKLFDEKAPNLNPCFIPEGDGFLDVKQASQYVNYSVSTVYRLVESKEIPFHRKSRRLYFLKEELHNWVLNKKD